MKGKHHYSVLTRTHTKDQILKHAKANGVTWEESPHEGVNWLRASSAIISHVDRGNDFHTDGLDKNTAQKMHKLYTQIRDYHKKTMTPHLRSAMSKLHSEKGDATTPPMDLLSEAHEHLNANGGHVWVEKVHTLVHLNKKIKHLESRMKNM